MLVTNPLVRRESTGVFSDDEAVAAPTAAVEAQVTGFGLAGGVAENDTLRGGIFVSRKTVGNEHVLNL